MATHSQSLAYTTRLNQAPSMRLVQYTNKLLEYSMLSDASDVHVLHRHTFCTHAHLYLVSKLLGMIHFAFSFIL